MRLKPFILILPLSLACALLLLTCKKETRSSDIDLVLDIIDSRSGGVSADFPKDVPVYPGLRGVQAVDFESAVTVSGTTGDNVDEVVSYYEAALTESGWNQEETAKSGRMLHLQYAKDGRTVGVGVSRNRWGKTDIILTVFEKTSLPDARKAAAEPDSSEARQIINRMAEAYANCGTYRDHGTVETVFFPLRKGKWTETLRFRTALVRPDHFRFEFVEDSDRYVVHSDPTGVRTWWDVMDAVEEEESLEFALAGATGISSGSAHTIPSLLLNETNSFSDARLDGVPCYRVEGKNQQGDVESLWIDKATHLVRRIDTGDRFPDFRTEETTLYYPQINIDIPPEELEFNPSGLISIPLWTRIKGEM